jgi:hypothetical protein
MSEASEIPDTIGTFVCRCCGLDCTPVTKNQIRKVTEGSTEIKCTPCGDHKARCPIRECNDERVRCAMNAVRRQEEDALLKELSASSIFVWEELQKIRRQLSSRALTRTAAIAKIDKMCPREIIQTDIALQTALVQIRANAGKGGIVNNFYSRETYLEGPTLFERVIFP